MVLNSGMGVFAVALPQFRQRFDHIVAHMQSRFGSNFDIVGVLGSDCDASVLAKNARLSTGQIGCAMSHLTIYRRMIELDLKSAFIVEDDVVLPANIQEILQAIAPTLQPGELIQLNNWKDGDCLLSRISMSEIAGVRLYQPLDAKYLGSACAYVIDRQAAEGILRINFPLRVTADNWEFFHKKGGLSTARVAFPSPVILKAFSSEIIASNTAKPNGLASWAKPLWEKVFSPLLAARRQWIIRQRSREVHLSDVPSNLSASQQS